MKVAIFGSRTSYNLVGLIQTFLQKLESKKVEYIIEKSFHKLLIETYNVNLKGIKTFTDKKGLDKNIDLFFTLGGDGTILLAGTIVKDLGIPIVGINTGRLGFLATIQLNEFLLDIDNILAKNFKVSERSMLMVESENEKIPLNFALNEIAVSRKETTSMITIETHINGEFLNTFWADGLIISTPTGSTGYSLSCGGPIIDPRTNNFVITPIAPHNLNVRPFIIPDDSEIELKIKSRVPQYSLSLDSRLYSLSTECKLTIRKNPFNLNIVQRDKNSYLSTLRKKLLWGSDSRN